MRPTKYSERALTLPGRSESVRPVVDTFRLRSVTAVGRPGWRTSYVRRLVASDVVCAAVAAVVGHASPFGVASAAATSAATVIALLLPAVWVFAMSAARTYEHRFLWEGSDEFRRVLLSAAVLLAIVGTLSWGVDLQAARGLVVVALPLATVGTLLERQAWRGWLRRQRRGGGFLQRTLLVGNRSGVDALRAQIARQTSPGHEVIGCCLPQPGWSAAQGVDDLRVLGNFDDVVGIVRRHDVETVAIVPSPEWDAAALQRLSWALEKTSAELLLAPTMTEVVGARVQVRPYWGLPLLHVAPAELSGGRRITKAVFDRGGAALGLVLLAPVLLGIAVFVKATSPGPVLYRQERVGRGGRPFSMLKFRTMVPGADHMVATLAGGNDGNGVLFKLRLDPRVTKVGRVLRRYSLDELPQLVNVVRGEMSLVGPRPPLPREADRYGFVMRRRFLVKPGLTGLWQISGRSDLSWDESVRLDVLYVENWSLGLDVRILWRTLGAVLRGSGAY
jgi:exopolysaccharide biosynthesis polyprenyl glycosylphosphotransferase